MSSDAEDLWHKQYREFREREDSLEDDLERDMVQRLHVFAMKFSMLYAIMDKRSVIIDEDLHKAVLIAQHLGDNALWILRNVIKAESKYTQLENRLLKFLKENKGRVFPYWRLHQIAGSRYERKTLLRSLETLVAAGLIVEVIKKARREEFKYWGTRP